LICNAIPHFVGTRGRFRNDAVTAPGTRVYVKLEYAALFAVVLGDPLWMAQKALKSALGRMMRRV